MSKTVLVAAKVDPGIKARLNAIASETGKSESEVVRDAILQFLEEDNPDSVRSMAARLSALERKFKLIARGMFN